MNLLDADFPGANISTNRPEVLHPGQCKLSEVSVLYTGTVNTTDCPLSLIITQSSQSSIVTVIPY